MYLFRAKELGHDRSQAHRAGSRGRKGEAFGSTARCRGDLTDLGKKFTRFLVSRFRTQVPGPRFYVPDEVRGVGPAVADLRNEVRGVGLYVAGLCSLRCEVGSLTTEMSCMTSGVRSEIDVSCV